MKKNIRVKDGGERRVLSFMVSLLCSRQWFFQGTGRTYTSFQEEEEEPKKQHFSVGFTFLLLNRRTLGILTNRKKLLYKINHVPHYNSSLFASFLLYFNYIFYYFNQTFLFINYFNHIFKFVGVYRVWEMTIN